MAENQFEEEANLQRELEKIIERALKDKLIELASEDVKVIVKEMMPDMDRIIADKVKNHFYEIGQYLVEKFK